MKRMLIAMLATVALVAACSSGAVVVSPAPSSPTAPSAAAPASLSPSPVPTSALGFVPGTVESPRSVKITTDDKLSFVPNVITVAEGETVTFAISNTGTATHEFMLGPAADAMADAEGTPEVADILAGETKTLTFTFEGPGPYAFACHEPGHFEAGMLGYVVVVGPDVSAVGTVAQPRLVAVDMSDQLKFAPAEMSVAKGETVTFLVSNLGTVVHEFAVGPADKVDADEVDGTIVKEADEIDAHRVKTVTYTFDGAGPYGFACHEPGHFQAGMKGSITFTN
jgi:uncharacterized cupredoxin-like copper-binding protein